MNTTTLSMCGYDEKTGNCTQNPCCRANEELVKLLKHGASIARDRGINLDYAKVADEAAEAIYIENQDKLTPSCPMWENVKNIQDNDTVNG